MDLDLTLAISREREMEIDYVRSKIYFSSRLVCCIRNSLHISNVIPANLRESGGRAGIQVIQAILDSRFRGNDNQVDSRFLNEL